MHKILTKLTNKTKKPQLPVSLRTKEHELQYLRAKLAGDLTPLHLEQRLREWQHWVLIENRFPYSLAFKVHHMLIPKRVVNKKDLTEKELNELQVILDELSETYDCHLTNFKKKQSIIGHFHIHMLIYKDERN